MLGRLLLALVATALVVAPLATAHKTVSLTDEHDATIGWRTEPPVVDQLNAITVKVSPREAPAALGSGDIPAEGTYSFTFLEAGEHGYHCHPHPWMQGNITVAPADGHGHEAQTHHVKILDGDAPGDYRFEPENLTIHVGDTVHWMNEGAMAHTVSPGLPGADGSHGHDEGHDEGHDHGGDAHAHGEGGVEGLEKTLQLELTIAGKARTFDLVAVHGEPGLYEARFVPTVAGAYTVRLFGDLHDAVVETSVEVERVEPLSKLQFPETTKSAYEMQRALDALEAEAKTQAESPADVAAVGDAETPAPGLALVALAGLAALALRRRA